MRNAYHEQLDSIACTLHRMADLVSGALARATHALLEADLSAAEAVIAGDREVDAVRADLDTLVVELIARQQPVAGDLRKLVGALRMSGDLERMGDLAAHIAKIARMRHPECAIPAPLRETVESMGRIAAQLGLDVGRIVESGDARAARGMAAADDAVDGLHRAVFAELHDGGYKLETTIDVTLVSRYYERFADHAVKVADGLVFLVGEARESEAGVGGDGAGRSAAAAVWPL